MFIVAYSNLFINSSYSSDTSTPEISAAAILYNPLWSDGHGQSDKISLFVNYEIYLFIVPYNEIIYYAKHQFKCCKNNRRKL